MENFYEAVYLRSVKQMVLFGQAIKGSPHLARLVKIVLFPTSEAIWPGPPGVLRLVEDITKLPPNLEEISYQCSACRHYFETESSDHREFPTLGPNLSYLFITSSIRVRRLLPWIHQRFEKIICLNLNLAELPSEGPSVQLATLPPLSI